MQKIKLDNRLNFKQQYKQPNWNQVNRLTIVVIVKVIAQVIIRANTVWNNKHLRLSKFMNTDDFERIMQRVKIFWSVLSDAFIGFY